MGGEKSNEDGTRPEAPSATGKLQSARCQVRTPYPGPGLLTPCRSLIDGPGRRYIFSAVKEPIVRVDDRLVHGQVLAGWVEPLGIRRVVVASDAVAADELERELYRAAVPEGVEFAALTVSEAAEALGQPDGPRTMALVGSIGEARRLVEAGLKPARLNVGGVHRGPGRVEVLPFVWLTEDERQDCRWLAERGVKLEAQMLPDSQVWDLATLLEAS